MSGWTVYWVMRLDAIGILFEAVTVTSLIATIISIFLWAGGKSEKAETPIKIGRTAMRIFPPILLIGVLCWTFTPSTKQMCAILVLPEIANSEALEQIQEDAGDIYKLGVDAIKDAIGEKDKSTD